MAQPVYAQTNQLTRENIKNFVQKTTKLAHQNSDLNASEVTSFLQKHLYDKGIFRTIMTYHIPGYPPQPQNMSLDKDLFIENVLEGRKTIENYNSSVEITDIQITNAGQTATIRTNGTESGIMPVDKKQKASFKGQSECKQHLAIKDNVIQMISAECFTDVTFTGR
jgi:hypothetical protein